MQSSPQEHPPSFWISPTGITLCVVAAVAAYFLLTEHRAHLAGWLPYALLAACPLMHLFMHHGHGQGGHEGHGGPAQPVPPASGGKGPAP